MTYVKNSIIEVYQSLNKNSHMYYSEDLAHCYPSDKCRKCFFLSEENIYKCGNKDYFNNYKQDFSFLNMIDQSRFFEYLVDIGVITL